MINRLILILLIGLIKIGAVHSQCCPYLGNIEIIPENPGTLDSIYLVTNVTTPNVGLYLGYEIENNTNNNIIVRACYWEGVFTALTDFTDTINLGVISSGMYTLNFIALSSIDNYECIPNDSNSVELLFEVSTVNSADNIQYENKIKCFPNPLSDQNLWIHSSKRIEAIVIVNISGQTVLNIEKPNTFYYEVDLRELDVGTYLIRVIDENNVSTIQKVVKMK